MIRAGVMALLALGLPLAAQTGGRVEINIPALEDKADEVVAVNLEGKTLDQGRKLLLLRKGISKSFAGLLGGLKGIYRRTYRFGHGNAPEPEDVESIHERLAGQGWSPMIEIKDRGTSETLTVYSYVEGELVTGVTVVSSDPSEVTVVNIVGDVDLEALAEIGSQIGVPSMRLAARGLGERMTPLPKTPKAPAK